MYLAIQNLKQERLCNLTIHFSILGSGQLLKVFGKQSGLCEKIKHIEQRYIYETLYDSEKFNTLNIINSNNTLVSTFYELLPDDQHILYDLDRTSRLEIKIKNRGRIKIFFKDIVGTELLFPLHDFSLVENIFLKEKGLIVLENDIGNFGKCKIEAAEFDISKLLFDIIEFTCPEQRFISKIYYNNIELLFKKRDTLFNGKAVIIRDFA